MKITAERNQYNSKKNNSVSIIGAGVVGATTGYAAKYILPVTKEERANYYPDEFVKSTKEALKEVENIEIDSIRRHLGNDANESTKVFLNALQEKVNGGSKKPLLDAYHNADEATKKIMKETISQVQKAKKFAKSYAQVMQDQLIKQGRSNFTFISAGAVVAVGTAFVHNVIQRINSDK